MRLLRFMSPLRRAVGALSERSRASILYFLTFVSTTFVGLITYGSGSILRALCFSVPLMAILTSHELGHYLQLRRYRLRASWPRFIPLPLPPLGTFGAVLHIREPIPNRRILFDMGASGPVAGLVVAVAFLGVGLSLSSFVASPPANSRGVLTFGAPILMEALARLLAPTKSDVAQYVLLHPTAVAGWVGLFLTSLNLTPVGQLDGGHVLYALLGRKGRWISYLALGLMCVVATLYRFWGWFVLVALLSFFGLKRFSTLDDAQPLGLWRSTLALLVLGYLFVGFIPKPMEVVEPSSSPASHVANVADEFGRSTFVFQVAL